MNLTVEVNNNIVPALFFESEIIEIIQKISGYDKKIRGLVEINIISDAEMRQINKQYRGKNKVTDVLSFAWQEDKIVASNFLGQIYICLPQIKRQAKEYGVTAQEEFKRMLTHGLLHLIGYDHQVKSDEKKMFTLQNKILLGL
ncbi:MAG: rRNA maturation RNase YbeY [Patescibacteria group bacterium]|nr:rRNA maturation RNase YbeY [Patescibacteria group bacterium]